MKKLTLIAIILLQLFIVKAQTPSQLSEEFLNKMIRGQFDSCQVYFDQSVRDKINANMMRSMWERVPSFVGEFKSYGNIRTEKSDSLDIVLMMCTFEKTKLDLKLSFNSAQKIVGIFFVPPKSNAVYNVPEYYKPEKLYETKIPLLTGEYKMPGALCVPNNIENPPVVIFLAGSGPNDKDETIGPNKLLKDLALGLATNGIASYRYDKRTLAEGAKLQNSMDKVGLNEEVFEDALSAVKLLRANALTKNSKIFIVGHSLGAMCAPMIAKRSKDVSGIVLMAGPSRPFEDVVFDQIKYLAQLDSVLDDEDKKQIAEYESQCKTVKDPKLLKKAESKNLPLGMTSFYWQSVKDYDMVKTAKGVKQPILILQGERDYQVTLKDFDIWKKELGEKPKNKFITYPKLNHLFMKGEGICTPAEYQKSGNAEEQVIKDIVSWIKTN